MSDQTPSGGPAAVSHWICQPYGAPTPSSEVSRVAGYYCAPALTAFGGVPAARAEKAA